MSEDVGAKIISGKARARESKNDKGDFDKTAYALNVAKEALEEAESSLASASIVIQPIVEAIEAVAMVAAAAAKQGSDLSQQGDEKARASVREDLQCSKPCQGIDDNDSSTVGSNSYCDDKMKVKACLSAHRLIQLLLNLSNQLEQLSKPQCK